MKKNDRKNNLAKNNLEDLREKINEVDLKLLKLLHERIDYVKQIGFLKQDQQIDIYDPQRERKIYEKLISYNEKINGNLTDGAIRNIFNEVISYCRSLEKDLPIGYLGPQGSYTFSATVKQFGFSANLVSYSRIADVFWAVKNDKVKFGVVPFENSIEGMVNNSLDLLAKGNFKIYSQFYMAINLNLLSREKSLEDIKILYSHPQPFAQARNWIEKKFPHVALKETNSTSEAAKLASEHPASGCIGSLALLKSHPKLNSLEENIEDRDNNMTRFLVISKEKQEVSYTKNCFTSLVVFIKDKKGALYEILSILAAEGINLNNIISRPSLKKNFDYYFFIEFIGHENAKKVRLALSKIEKKVLELKVLGSYGRGNK